MSIELTGIVPRNERRLRLVFSSALAAGAFGSPAPAAYVVDREDTTPSPGVAAAIIVSGSANNAELALSIDLVEGGLYRVRAIGIPGADASTSTSLSDQRFRFQISTKPYNVEPKTNDRELLLYGRDIVHTGLDYLETADGDLATVSGAQNAMGAIRRRMLGTPLVWAPDYSARAREYVDIPVPAVGTLRGRLEAQALRDDRVKSVSAKLVIDVESPEQTYFEVIPVLIGGQSSAPVDVHVFV